MEINNFVARYQITDGPVAVVGDLCYRGLAWAFTPLCEFASFHLYYLKQYTSFLAELAFLCERAEKQNSKLLL